MLVPHWKFENGKFIGIVWVTPQEMKALKAGRDIEEPIKKAS